MITQFSQNFYMAVSPQIIKSYANGDINYMRSLVLNSSRYSFFMLFVVSIPLYVSMEPLLKVWLGKDLVSFEMIRFCQYTIIYTLVNILEQPITMAVRATGNIKGYQITVGSLTLSFIPFCILLFILGAPSYSSMLLLSILYLAALIIRVHFVSPIIQIKKIAYARHVVLPIFIVIVTTIIIISSLSYIPLNFKYNEIIEGCLSLLVSAIAIYMLGLNKKERYMIKSYLLKKGNKGVKI